MTPYDLDTMARTVWGEARGESLQGKVGVAWVIRNRADHPDWWGDEIATVCLKKAQFSCWLETDPNRAKLMAVTPENESFRECLMVTAGVLTGNFPDPTGGANHYHAKSVNPKWARGKEPTVRLHNHVFYRL